VLREGTLSGAARALGLTQPTLGRQIADLEDQLGTALFVRSQRGLSPTDAARDMAPHAKKMEAAADSLMRAVSGGLNGTGGTVRISASEIIGAEVLPGLLAQFRRSNPDIAIELVLSNRLEDLLRGDADIAVRMVRPRQQALLARRIGEVGIGPVRSSDHLRHSPPPETLTALRSDHALDLSSTGSPAATRSWWPFCRTKSACQSIYGWSCTKTSAQANTFAS
jgi:DNA-binding transcriptional LysR family regulator